jgi:hypothetical protein
VTQRPFSNVDMKRNALAARRSVLHEGRLVSGLDDLCYLFAELIQQTYANDVWKLCEPGQDLEQDDPPFGAVQFPVNEVQSVLLDLDISKGAGPDGILPLILKNFASTLFYF